MASLQKIGILTSGGDAPGMNAAIRAVVRTAVQNGIRVIGIRKGYNGLLNGDMFEMNLRSVSDIMHRGGTILGTARCNEFREDAGVEKAKNICKSYGIDGVVVLGGDGSFRGARDLSQKGIPCVGIPCTIDNDIGCSDYTIGFDTALNTAIEAVDRLRDTSQSHDRCSVVEIMGHGAGHLALHTALACGALATWVKEVPFDVNKDIIEKMKYSFKMGKHHSIVVVSEDIVNVYDLAKQIYKETGVESRATILGHIQRGGSPSGHDRTTAASLGYYAVQLLAKGIGNRVVVVKDSHVVDYDILEALKQTKSFDMELYKMSNLISI